MRGQAEEGKQEKGVREGGREEVEDLCERKKREDGVDLANSTISKRDKSL